MAKPSGAVLNTLSVEERAAVLTALMDERPELRETAERLAAARVGSVDRDEVAEQVRLELGDIPLDEFAACSGRQRGQGYVEPHEAAWELVEGRLQPYIDDLYRRTRLGMTQAARELGLGILEGLAACPDPPEAGSVLAYAGEDTIWDLVQWVRSALSEAACRCPPTPSTRSAQSGQTLRKGPSRLPAARRY